MRPSVLPLLILVPVLLLLLTGCDLFNPPPSVDYHTGTYGAMMEFMGNTPPDTVFEEDEFNVDIKIWNQGAFDLNGTCPFEGYLYPEYDKGYLTLLSISYSSLGSEIRSYCDNRPLDTVNPPAVVRLAGKSLVNPSGEMEMYDFLFKANPLVGQRESPETTVRFKLCYPYETFFAKQVCIDKDIYDLDQAATVCQSETLSFDGQGAPIAVTQIEPTMVTRNVVEQGKQVYHIIPSFRITIRNKGNGIPVLLNNTPPDVACLAMGADTNDYNKINISASIAGTQLICTPEVLRFKDDEATAVCKVKEGDYLSSSTTSNFLSVLTIKLDYLYVDYLAEEVSIMRLIS